MLLSGIVKRGRVLRNLCCVRNYEAASKMADYRLHPSVVRYKTSTRAYWVPELGISVPPESHSLLRVLWQARALKRAGVSFYNDSGEIIAHTASFKVAVENEEELFILREIVAQGVYNLFPSSPGVVVLDVGMNVGFAALHFAAQPWIEAVWAYEPVPATYARALQNLCRNPQLSSKITAYNFGVGDQQEDTTFEYSPLWRGASGVLGLTPEFRRYHRIARKDVSRVPVRLGSACEVVRDARAAYPNARLVLKLDCEGCEYRIIAALQRASLLREVDTFLIEWHTLGASGLVQDLNAGGFDVLSLTSAESRGMLYACRRPAT